MRPTSHRHAQFGPDDPQDVIDDAFRCPSCSAPSGIPQLFSYGKGWTVETIARCRCSSCRRSWTLTLDVFQLFRITGLQPWTGPHPADMPEDPFE